MPVSFFVEVPTAFVQGSVNESFFDPLICLEMYSDGKGFVP